MTGPAFDLEPTLTGSAILLRPLRAGDAGDLLAAASDGALWTSSVTVVPGPDTVEDYVAAALAEREQGKAMPFVIQRRSDSQIVGSTRMRNIDPANRSLEIGYSWLAQSAQRTGANRESKFLLLTHAFEVMECIRVQFSTDENNQPSRIALLGIGAHEEGLVRFERIMPDGRFRNSVRFSIIAPEWPGVKAMLSAGLVR